ncbi:hypothetical protein QYE76_056080 [Lolium multiflorum]|uniref:Uncharacterized protein n=1 Tax=Lolium multiflorum TaxID=4521 RepID=A0AAD8T0Y0_LOLMU|nr:hypothetical protein QYE76_056080 [Lolium multiflorum]
MVSLRGLFMQSSGFSGAIHETFLWIEQLEALGLSMNSLAGPVPPGFGIKFQKLLSLDMSLNGFSGAFPTGIVKCLMLQRFEVQGNAFTGELPVGLWSLPVLQVLRTHNNRFFGRLPEFPDGEPRLEQV